jgi:hypothetical protein
VGTRLENDALDSGSEDHRVEVQQQAYMYSLEFQMREQLGPKKSRCFSLFFVSFVFFVVASL